MKKILSFALIVCLLSCNKSKIGHECMYNLCPFKGQINFIPESGCNVGSECYYLDIIHFEHPALNYDGCEELLIKNNQ